MNAKKDPGFRVSLGSFFCTLEVFQIGSAFDRRAAAFCEFLTDGRRMKDKISKRFFWGLY